MQTEHQQVLSMLKQRNSLIDALTEGVLSKDQFLEENYRLIERLRMKPFQVLSHFEYGLYNYQYYNTMAKYFLRKKYQTHSKRREKECDAAVRNFYFQKDRCILQILDAFREGIEAYPVDVRSLRLQHQLIEIVYTEQEKVIFHTINPQIKQRLIAMGVYSDCCRQSKIHAYINQTFGEQEGVLWK